MRQIFAYVPEGQGARAMEMARKYDAINLACLKSSTPEGDDDVVIIQTSNVNLDPLLHDLQEIENLRVTFHPSGVIPLAPPAEEAPEQVKDVSPKSSMEIYMSGLQSIGSWKGFLGYAFSAGVVVWIGLHSNVIFLLTAAMLIAPFAGPAMTLAMGTARGDRLLVKQSVIRYFSAIVLTIFTAFLLSLIFGQKKATELMADTSFIHASTILLPLVAGAAGALNLCQSERNSLVTAAGPGMLIAASLAPPAGITGMALGLGEWEMAKRTSFLLVVQLVGINLSGALIFSYFGLKPKGVRYDRGENQYRWISGLASLIILAGLISWQFSNKPHLLRSTQSQAAAEEVKELIHKSGLAKLVEVNVRFTRSDIEGQNTLLIDVYAQKSSAQAKDIIEQSLTRSIKERIKQKGFNVKPLVDVTVLEP